MSGGRESCEGLVPRKRAVLKELAREMSIIVDCKTGFPSLRAVNISPTLLFASTLLNQNKR